MLWNTDRRPFDENLAKLPIAHFDEPQILFEGVMQR